MYTNIKQVANEMRNDLVEFTQKLIQTPSISGEDGELAHFCQERMRKIGYDESFIDGIGNVVGIIKGNGKGTNIMFNSHLDHVDPGDYLNWQFHPYSGKISEGFIHGRAASDTKGGMAAQIYVPALLKEVGISLKGDIIVTGVVQEEPAGMFGMRYLVEKTFAEKGIDIDLMISSEATSLNLYLGHRGRVELEIKTKGRTSHSSAPFKGINAVYKMLDVIERIRRIERDLPKHEFLGKSSLALTNIYCKPGRLSIIPDECTVLLDRRLNPGEKINEVVDEVNRILQDLRNADPNFDGEVRIPKINQVSYTGYTGEVEKYMPAWVLDQNNNFVQQAFEALRALGQDPMIGRWDFGTDAGYITGVKGIPTIGYSPMEEKYAHTPMDRVSIDYLVKALAGNAALACKIVGVKNL